MTLDELVEVLGRGESAVPEWLQCGFKRRSITFADGREDRETSVVWLQAGAMSFDIRIPPDASPDDPVAFARREGGVTTASWEGEIMDWAPWTGFQTSDLWPEPGWLRRVGPCMIEFSPAGNYVEDWRVLPGSEGPGLALRLIEERDLGTGEVLHRGGGLVVSGDHAGFVRGRPAAESGVLGELAEARRDDPAALEALFAVDAVYGSRVGRGDAFEVELSVHPDRIGQEVVAQTGFGLEPNGRVTQRAEGIGGPIERVFEVARRQIVD